MGTGTVSLLVTEENTQNEVHKDICHFVLFPGVMVLCDRLVIISLVNDNDYLSLFTEGCFK
jgi:hypothetical protein